MSIHTLTLKIAEHPVKSVTIFQSSTAELKRAFTVELKVSAVYVCFGSDSN